MPAAPQYLTGDGPGIAEFIDTFDVFLFDCDGVLWSGDQLFEGTVDTLERLRKKGKQIIFVTNNSTKSRVEYKKKLNGMGIPATEDEVFGSAYSAAIYISRILALPAPRNKVFVLGEAGLEHELASESIQYIGGTDPAFARAVTAADFPGIASGATLDPDVGIVVAGLDYGVNYLKLAHAHAYLTRHDAVFLATNTDSTLPSAGALFPGAGSIHAPLVKMTGREPFVLGKPSRRMMDAIEGRFRFDRTKACMVGDRLNTDIRFGVESGLGGTLAVLTGVSKKADWEGVKPDAQGHLVQPRWYVDRLSDLLG
ncbi:MAG: hypothetical protein M1838_003160 [Thelocarpon superellum]|nr:MAG: hypothetical protein M1838_003160 [Thelocarpon superellum]